MKKLVVLGLAVVAAVFAANANQVKWTFSEKYTSAVAPAETPQNLNGFTAYLILQSDWTDGNYATLQANKIASATINLSTSSNTKSVTTSSYTLQGGTQVSETTKDTATGASFYVVIADDSNPTHFYTYTGTGDITVSGSNSGAQLSVTKTGANAMTQSQFASNTFADAPEPTSALLLLVGGAMLALRRRKA